ncbi:MAG: site-specific DNA-methyltransferase [Acidobacteria bacterium]|nr:site-specific DNA-methyltransferase [Acidobacteriota bacterium]
MTATPVIQEPVSITPALARRIEIWPVDRLVPYSPAGRPQNWTTGSPGRRAGSPQRDPPSNPKSTSGSGLLGTGARGKAAGKRGAADEDGRFRGLARPSNVIEARTESNQGSHSAPFPRGLAEFFVKAFSDARDVVFDPFMGSGTTMAAAALLDRTGYGCEISPAYCDVIVRRVMNLTGASATLAATGETFAAVAESRGVHADPKRKIA